MTGVTIDHMVSLVVLIAVLMVSMGAFGQIIGAAVTYQQNHEVSMKAAELANALLLSPGSPDSWGRSDGLPLAFGLQDSDSGGYSLDAFALSRLSSRLPLVYYGKTGLWYSNNSLGGGTLLVPMAKAVNYTTTARLLGVEGSYAFRLTVAPTLNVSLSELNLNPLTVKVEVRGLTGVVSDATLNYFAYQVVPQVGQAPSIQTISGTSRTDLAGSATLEFSSVDGSRYAYSVVIHARVGGLSGVGYRYRDIIANNKIVPLVEDFENRSVLLAHSWDLGNFPSPVEVLYFNATFLSLAQDFWLSEIRMADSGGFVRTGQVNYGVGFDHVRVQIPTQNAGILIVAYSSGDYSGIVTMPWGISVLGFSAIFGGDTSQADWVAVELRQVSISKISYQAKVAVWKTSGYQPARYTP
ncbi:MAG TPA: hypothetical protein VJ249_00525 [Candidatus Bathyarchaeia archaeon]|nr:hypothetical protein [Candidatus Bathyarchaeia archaeon]